MDDEIRQAFATLYSQGAVTSNDARAAAEAAREAVSIARRLEPRVATLEADLRNIQKHVYGSDPPPPPHDPILRQVSEHDGEIATVTGRLLAVEAKVDGLTTTQAEQLKLLNQISKAVGGVLGNPLVRRIAWGFGVALLGWMSTKGWLH